MERGSVRRKILVSCVAVKLTKKVGSIITYYLRASFVITMDSRFLLHHGAKGWILTVIIHMNGHRRVCSMVLAPTRFRNQRHVLRPSSGAPIQISQSSLPITRPQA